MTHMIRNLALAAAIASAPLTAMAQDTKTFVLNAVSELFIEGDVSALGRYWAKDYIQHNPMVPDGRDALEALFAQLPGPVEYEIGMVIAEGDLVTIHGRYTGLGPTPMIAVDIYRVADGKIAEHWDVLQEEVAVTASGNPMFSKP